MVVKNTLRFKWLKLLACTELRTSEEISGVIVELLLNAGRSVEQSAQ